MHILQIKGNGTISKNELLEAYKQTLNQAEQGVIEQEIENIMKNADIDNSGCINYTEWMMATINIKQLLSEQRLEMAFKM